jgi:hypothetical protein
MRAHGDALDEFIRFLSDGIIIQRDISPGRSRSDVDGARLGKAEKGRPKNEQETKKKNDLFQGLPSFEI